MIAARKTSVKTNAILNVIKTISMVVFPLITFPYVSRVLLVDSIGAYNFGASIVSFCSLIAGLGISTYAIREGSRCRDDQLKITDFSSEIFTINMISTFVAYVILGGCILFIPQIQHYALIVSIIGIEILFATLGVNWLCNVYEDFLYITLRSITIQFLSLLATFLLVKEPEDFYKYIGIVVCASSGANLLNFFYIRKRYVKFHFRFVPEMKRHIKPIMVIFFTTITITVYVSSDITILGFLSNDRQVGLYSAAVKIYTIIKSLVISIVTVLIPRFSRVFNGGDVDQVNYLFSKVFKTLIVLVFPIAFGLFMTSTDVLHLVVGEQYLDAGPSLAILSVAIIFSLFAYMYTNCVLIPLRKEKISLYAAVVSALVNVGLNILLIPRWGINAAAATTVVAEAIMCIISVCYSKKYVALIKTAKCIASTLIASLLIVLVCFVCNDVENHIIRAVLKIGFSGILYCLIMLLLKNEIAIEFTSVINNFYKSKVMTLFVRK